VNSGGESEGYATLPADAKPVAANVCFSLNCRLRRKIPAARPEPFINAKRVTKNPDTIFPKGQNTLTLPALDK
jgi:hypothetical protein